MQAGKKILYATIVCAIVALISWGFAIIYTMTHKSASGQAKKVTEEVGGGASTTSTTEEKTTNNSFYEHGLIVTDDFTIKLTGYKVINPGETGNRNENMPVIGFWYDVTNTSGREINALTAWTYCIRAIQDNDDNRVNELNMAALPDSRYLETETETIKQGGTVSNAVAYVLTDKTTPVTLKATDGIVGDELGEREFAITGIQTNQTTQAGQTTQQTPATQTQTPGATSQTQTPGATTQTQTPGTTSQATPSTSSSVPALADPANP